MTTVWRVLTWLLAGLAAIAVYELVRARVMRFVAHRFRRDVRAFVRGHGVHIDSFKLSGKLQVREELANDLRINEQVLERARTSGRPVDEVRDQVEEWIEEIVPFFSMLAYYKVGYRVAHTALRMLYEPTVDRTSPHKGHPGTTKDLVVYVANHRSNADYVLVSWVLARSIALSYAVGEWARVWPLEYLFKSFGSYFVRRREKDELYHLVLERYVQLVSRRRVTQGIFLEGGLSRDGKLRPPKVGLLDYIARVKLEDGFEGDVLFVPVGINYDQVLEDEALLREAAGKERAPPGLAKKLASLVRLCLVLPPTLSVNLVRTLTGRLRRYGYASVAFGPPVSLNDFLARHGGNALLDSPRKERRDALLGLGREVMDAVAKVVPVTPVALVARVLLRSPASLELPDLVSAVHAERRKLLAGGARIVTGRAFAHAEESRARLRDEAEDRRRDSVALDEELLDVTDAEDTVRLALDILARRRLLKRVAGGIVVDPASRALLEYYAWSIAGVDGAPLYSEPREARA